MAMRVFHINKSGGKKEITELVTTLSISGEYRSCTRTLSFGVIHGYSDKRTWLTQIETGDTIKVIDKDKVMFLGPVWTKQKETDGTTLDFTCRDYGIYLKQNKAAYSIKQMKPEAIAQKVCADYGIKVGSLAFGAKPISRIFNNASLYDIIMTAYTLGGAEGKKYYAIFEGDLFYVLEKGKKACDPLISGANLLSSAVSESLASMVNRVMVYNKDDKLLEEVREETDIADYGLLSEVLRISKDDTDYLAQAKKKLSGLEQKITVSNVGDSQYITGKQVTVTEPYTGLAGVFYIDADTHTWKNGLYSNKLTLNFQNLMDEKESGQDDE